MDKTFGNLRTKYNFYCLSLSFVYIKVEPAIADFISPIGGKFPIEILANRWMY